MRVSELKDKGASFIAAHRALFAGAVVLATALGVFLVAWFEPHKLFVDDRVDEALPGAPGVIGEPGPVTGPASAGSAPEGPAPAGDDPVTAAAPRAAEPAAEPPAPAEPKAPAPLAPAPVPPAPNSAAPEVLGRAGFRSLEHRTTGDALVLGLPDGSRVLRLERFETSNGPDLRVYLSAGSDDSFFGREYGKDFVELSELKGNIGDQNYVIPAGVDLSRYRNAVIWCKRFGVGFGVATLS